MTALFRTSSEYSAVYLCCGLALLLFAVAASSEKVSTAFEAWDSPHGGHTAYYATYEREDQAAMHISTELSCQVTEFVATI